MNSFRHSFQKSRTSLFILAALFLQAFIGTNCFAAADENSNAVSIKDMSFAPQTLTIPVGTTVTWTNQDSMPHTVTSPGKKKVLDSGELAQGGSYTYTFNEAGTYSYFCTVHPGMKGKVIVKASKN